MSAQRDLVRTRLHVLSGGAAATTAEARLAAILGVAERLTGTFDRSEIFQIVVDESCRGVGADGATIRILDHGALRVVAAAGRAREVMSDLPVVPAGEGGFGEVIRTGRPWICDDVRAATRAADPDLPAPTASATHLYERYATVHPFAADLVVPLAFDGRVIGAVSVVRDVPYQWTEADVEYVSTLATHASIAIRNADLFDRAETRAARMAVLQAASARMNRENTVESVGRAIVEEMRGIFDYHNARVYLIESPGVLVPIAFEGAVGAYEKVDPDVLRTRLGVGFTGWAAEHGEPLLIGNANADPRGSTIPGTDDVDESMLVTPMTYDGKVVGTITLSKLGLDQFDEEDLQLLTILADQAATALESARLLVRTQGLAGELRRLLDMSGELSGSLDPKTVGDLIASHLGRALGADECTISYWDRAGDRCRTSGFYSIDPRGVPDPEYRLVGFPATRRVLEHQETTFVDVDDPAADRAEVELLRREGHRSLVMLPLVAKGESIGLVELVSTAGLTFDPGRLALVRTMANEAAIALENATLYEAARSLADHDPLTGFHNHRYLQERLGEEIVRAQRAKSHLSVLMIDLDDFKLVNDTFGHLFGDRVLIWSADVIRSALRASDVPARYGGDEFAVILPEADGAAAEAVADRIRATFAERSFTSETRGAVPVGASIGWSTFPADGRTSQDLLATADAGLYRDKAAGRSGRGGDA